MATINPYLVFNGNCAEAFDFYKAAFGGTFAVYSKFAEAPGEMAQGADADRLMHVSLPLGNGSVLMGSDRLSSMGEGKTGDNFSISVNTASQEEATELFNNLSAGGTVTMPLDKTFWGAFFGMFTDKFGIAWMVNYDVNEQP